MKNDFKKCIIALGIGTGMLLTLPNVFAAWNEPGSMPPAGNIAAPLHQGSLDQLKDSGLTLNGNTGLIVWRNALFSQKTVIDGAIRGVAGTPETVFFGGEDSAGIKYLVDLWNNGKMSVVGAITDEGIRHEDERDDKHICANAVGQLIPCAGGGGSSGGGGCSRVGDVRLYNGTCAPSVRIESPYLTIDNVTGIAGFTYDVMHPVGAPAEGYSTSQSGTHSTFSHEIIVSVRRPRPDERFGFGVRLSKNGYLVDCGHIFEGGGSIKLVLNDPLTGGPATFSTSPTAGDSYLQITSFTASSSILTQDCKSV